MRDTTYAERLRSASKRELTATCMELARVAVDAEPREVVGVLTPTAAYALVKDLGRGKQEQLVGLYLDSQNKLIRRVTVSVGTLNTTRTHPREILFPAVQHMALGFVLKLLSSSISAKPWANDILFSTCPPRRSVPWASCSQSANSPPIIKP